MEQSFSVAEQESPILAGARASLNSEEAARSDGVAPTPLIGKLTKLVQLLNLIHSFLLNFNILTCFSLTESENCYTS